MLKGRMENIMDLIKMTRDLGVAIQQSPEFKRIYAAKAANDSDKELQALIDEFNMTRVKLSTAMQAEEKDEEKMSEYDTSLKSIYEKVMSNPNMLEFNAAKKEMDAIMIQINTILDATLNGDDPTTCEAEKSSCGGSCSSCSGCH